MVIQYLYMNSPIYLEGERDLSLPPVVSEGCVYLLNEQIFFEVLEKIDLYNKFQKVVKKDGCKSLTSWLNYKGLLNSAFLEEVSDCFFSSNGIKKINNFRPFKKGLNNKHRLNGDLIRNSFEKSLLYKYMQDNQKEFNEYVAKELEIISIELSGNKFNTALSKRINYYKNNIVNILMHKFIEDFKNSQCEQLEFINSIDVDISSEIRNEDLCLCKCGVPLDAKNNQIRLNNITQNECIAENTAFKIEINPPSARNYDYENDIRNLLRHSLILAQDKLNFDKKNIYRLLGHINSQNDTTLESATGISFNSMHFSSSNYEEQKMQEAAKVALCTKENTEFSTVKYFPAEYDNIKFCSIDAYYDNAKTSNFLLCDSDFLIRSICLMNLDEPNIHSINNVVLDADSNIEQSVLKLVFDDNMTTYSPMGYAYLNY